MRLAAKCLQVCGCIGGGAHDMWGAGGLVGDGGGGACITRGTGVCVWGGGGGEGAWYYHDAPLLHPAPPSAPGATGGLPYVLTVQVGA